MSSAGDWLAELRQSKQQAIARAQAASDERQVFYRTAQEQLQADQSALAAFIQTARIEPLLREFCTEILDGHPNFLGCELTRTVRSRAAGSSVDITEPEPWTGPVDQQALSSELNLGNGRYIRAVEWRLQSNYRSTEGHELKPFRIAIATAATGIRLDGQLLSAATAEHFQRALLDAFNGTMHGFSRRRSHRHHRRWYERLWKALFPTGKASLALMVGTVLVILLSAALAFQLSQALGGRP